MHESDNKSVFISVLLTRWNDLLIVVVATHDTQKLKNGEASKELMQAIMQQTHSAVA